MRIPSATCAVLSVALLAMAWGCADADRGADGAPAPPASPLTAAGSDASVASVLTTARAPDLAPWRLELLADAFAIATSIPEDPHERDKAKAQEWCAAAALTLDQVDIATQYAEAMGTWRQATMLADIGGWHAQRGNAAEMERFAERALALAPLQRDWQQERIRVHAARAYARAGRDTRAAALSAGVGEAEQGKVEAVVASRGGDTPTLPDDGVRAPTFDEQMVQVDEWIMTLNFDLTRNAADVCIALYAGCQDSAERCARVERSVTAANSKLPPDIRIGNLLALARIAASAGQMDRAKPLVSAAEDVLNSGTWVPEDEIVQVAAIALGKHGVGQSDEARTDLAQALALFDERRDTIIDIFRAAPLRAVAVAQAKMGDRAEALKTFRRAVEEGAVNPNARPRAEDLTETCVAMVLQDVDPGDEGRARIREIRDGLKDPW
jgi:tetratricopeptide (TPR) repeat protein